MSKLVNSAIILIESAFKKRYRDELGAFHFGFTAMSQMREKRFWEKSKA
ncbi:MULTISPECIES: hypothetical protein [Bacillus]|uniref:Uncharacterized protein n=1 Tax=Bacillus altitudinis TaxID=293387 RepID=A0A653NJE1_BACAB|nr:MULTISPECIES: hypothetical protein [Bacillus]EIL82851.1 hypothetical protein BAME_39280 [Bacillus sp. M 2-6]MDN0039960.1 hypothetical protein [Bacillus aerophilus]KIL29283.1 hypothetical protein B4133_1108 [Bacillus altitudinis]MCI9886695.1 hypothetical protein [Bacillus altitudinis]MCM3046750.1 hypothetical protein [Bacillus altitudinis]